MGGSRNFRDDVTHWPLTGSDSYGGFTFGTPIKIIARYQDSAVLFRSADGEEEVSKAIVYLGVPINVGDYIARGDLTVNANPTTIGDTYRVRQIGRSTDLRAAEELYKAYL